MKPESQRALGTGRRLSITAESFPSGHRQWEDLPNPRDPSALLGLVTLSFCLCLVLYKSNAIHPFLTSVNILGLEHRSFHSRNNWQFIPVLSIKRTRRNLKQTILWMNMLVTYSRVC